MNLLAYSTCIIALACVGSCGPAVDVNGDDTNATTAGDSQTGDPSTGDGDTTDAPTTDADTTGEPACQPILDEPLDAPSTVVMRNDTAAPLFVGFDGGCLFLPFELVGPDDGSLQWQRGDCAASCSDVIADGCFECGPCEGPSVLRLGPGESWEREWDGGVFHDQPVPAECVAEPCQPQCEQRTALAPGDYTLRTEARAECPADDPNACACPDGATTCVLTFAADEFVAATALSDATLTHPGAVELVFP